MDLRSLPDGLTPEQRCNERRSRVEKELGIDLSALSPKENSVGHADEKNCEQMIGHVPLPVGIAGPLSVTFSSGERKEIYLPLATTEGALVASVNRGCKAVSASGGVKVSSVHHGVTRSIALKIPNSRIQMPGKLQEIKGKEKIWKEIGEATSKHLKILKYDLDSKDDHIFLTIYADTDEAMGMNMVTIAADAIGKWVSGNIEGLEFITVAANVDSDKKPSARIHARGRGYEVTAEATLTPDIIASVLKSSPEAMLAAAHAKLTLGSEIAGALGSNLHAANIIATLYLATGQDAAHVVEGSLTDTRVNELANQRVNVSVRCPAILVGVRGGGTTLPAQSQCLKLLLNQKTLLSGKQQLAESIGAAVLAGETSLLAAQSVHQLAKAHTKFARSEKLTQ